MYYATMFSEAESTLGCLKLKVSLFGFEMPHMMSNSTTIMATTHARLWLCVDFGRMAVWNGIALFLDEQDVVRWY